VAAILIIVLGPQHLLSTKNVPAIGLGGRVGPPWSTPQEVGGLGLTFVGWYTGQLERVDRCSADSYFNGMLGRPDGRVGVIRWPMSTNTAARHGASGAWSQTTNKHYIAAVMQTLTTIHSAYWPY